MMLIEKQKTIHGLDDMENKKKYKQKWNRFLLKKMFLSRKENNFKKCSKEFRREKQKINWKREKNISIIFQKSKEIHEKQISDLKNQIDVWQNRVEHQKQKFQLLEEKFNKFAEDVFAEHRSLACHLKKENQHIYWQKGGKKTLVKIGSFLDKFVFLTKMLENANQNEKASFFKKKIF